MCSRTSWNPTCLQLWQYHLVTKRVIGDIHIPWTLIPGSGLTPESQGLIQSLNSLKVSTCGRIIIYTWVPIWLPVGSRSDWNETAEYWIVDKITRKSSHCYPGKETGLALWQGQKVAHHDHLKWLYKDSGIVSWPWLPVYKPFYR